MNVITKQDLATKLGVHIRTLCYHLKSKKGFKGYKVLFGIFTVDGVEYRLPEGIEKRTKLVFIEEEVNEFFKGIDESKKNTRF